MVETTLDAPLSADEPKRDFPFYDGRPARISAWGWLVLFSFSAAGFVTLAIAPAIWPAPYGRAIGVAGFLTAPLAGLYLAAGPSWLALFRRPTARDIWIGLAFAPATLISAALAAVLVFQVAPTVANPATDMVREMSAPQFLAFLGLTAPQLLGEELLALLPFLGLLTLLHAARAPRWLALAVAMLGSALVFGALHLPTYDWRLAQAFLVIGAARIALTLPYLFTKSIWSSFVAHVAHDWVLLVGIWAVARASTEL